MDFEILHTPYDAMRGAEDFNFIESSPPSSPCSLTAVDSSPPDSPSLIALQFDANIDEDSEEDSQLDATPTNSQGKRLNVEVSPAHPYSASTRASKRPPLYGKDSERSKFKKAKFDQASNTECETLSDATGRKLNFASSSVCSAHRHSSPDAPMLENAISLNDEDQFLRLPGSVALSSSERVVWEDAIDKATMERENIIDLTQKGLTYIPTNITDLNNRVVFDRNASPTQPRRPPGRIYSRSTSLAALGQSQDDIHLMLGGNQLTRLPQELLRVDNLTVLSLRGNKLTEIPPSICGLKHLKDLNVANNRLNCLPAEINLLNLQILAVDPNPFLENPHVGKDKNKDEYVGPITRRHSILPLFEFSLRALVAIAPIKPRIGMHATTSLSSPIFPTKAEPRTIFEDLYDLPLATGESDLLSPHIRDTLSACVPRSIGHTLSPHASPARSLGRGRKSTPCVSTCRSTRHLDVREAGKQAVFVDHAEERIVWSKYACGLRFGGDGGIPLLWRGCSPGCLTFLDEQITSDLAAGDDGSGRHGEDDWSMDVDGGATASPRVELVGGGNASEFGQFNPDDIDLDD